MLAQSLAQYRINLLSFKYVRLKRSVRVKLLKEKKEREALIQQQAQHLVRYSSQQTKGAGSLSPHSQANALPTSSRSSLPKHDELEDKENRPPESPNTARNNGQFKIVPAKSMSYASQGSLPRQR